MTNRTPYMASTRGIAVRVEPTYLESRSSPDGLQYFWAYRVMIKNQGWETVQLRSRHWMITNARGELTEVKGSGVIGKQPFLKPRLYSCIATCAAKSFTMWSSSPCLSRSRGAAAREKPSTNAASESQVRVASIVPKLRSNAICTHYLPRCYWQPLPMLCITEVTEPAGQRAETHGE